MLHFLHHCIHDDNNVISIHPLRPQGCRTESDTAFNGKTALKEGQANVEMGSKACLRRNQINGMRSANWTEN